MSDRVVGRGGPSGVGSNGCGGSKNDGYGESGKFVSGKFVSLKRLALAVTRLLTIFERCFLFLFEKAKRMLRKVRKDVARLSLYFWSLP